MLRSSTPSLTWAEQMLAVHGVPVDSISCCSSDASANLCVPAGYKKPIEGYNLLRSLDRICGSFNGVPKLFRVTLIALVRSCIEYFAHDLRRVATNRLTERGKVLQIEFHQ